MRIQIIISDSVTGDIIKPLVVQIILSLPPGYNGNIYSTTGSFKINDSFLFCSNWYFFRATTFNCG